MITPKPLVSNVRFQNELWCSGNLRCPLRNLQELDFTEDGALVSHEAIYGNVK